MIVSVTDTNSKFVVPYPLKHKYDSYKPKPSLHFIATWWGMMQQTSEQTPIRSLTQVHTL